MRFNQLGNYRFLSYWFLLKDMTDSLTGTTLDAGCGTGTMNMIDTVGIDIEKSRLRKFSKKGGMAVLASVTHLPFKTEAFDNAVLIDVLEHVDSKKRATITELARVVKKTLVGSTTNLLNPYMMLDLALPQAIHRRLTSMTGPYLDRHSRLTTAQLTRVLRETGFSVELLCLSAPPFQHSFKWGKQQKIPWYGYVWIVTDKLISKINVAKSNLVFRATK